MKNLKNLETRLNFQGGAAQQDRMIRDKYESFQRAVKYSYQGAKIQTTTSDEIIPALINSSKVLADYDEKILSVDFKYGFKPGDVFKWNNPSIVNHEDTYWLIYLQDLTELAYFKADIRKCNYQIKWFDKNQQEHKTYASLIGPKEQKIPSITKSSFNMDLVNYTIMLLIPKNNDTLQQFARYQEFYLQDLNQNSNTICWRVEAVDSLSLPGILEVYAREYYSNRFEDNLEEGVVEGLIVSPLTEQQIAEENKGIVGDNFITPMLSYTFEGQGEYTWSYDVNLPIQSAIYNNKINIVWDAPYEGDFKLYFGPYTKTIIVRSMF